MNNIKVDIQKSGVHLKELEKTLELFQSLEERNLHGEAIQLVCSFKGYTELTNKMECTNKLHRLYGCLTKELQTMRNEIWEKVSKDFYILDFQVKENLPYEEAEKRAIELIDQLKKL